MSLKSKSALNLAIPSFCSALGQLLVRVKQSRHSFTDRYGMRFVFHIMIRLPFQFLRRKLSATLMVCARNCC